MLEILSANRKKFLPQKGIGIIEIIIAVAILGLAFFAIFEGVFFYLRSFDKVEESVKASYLAQEAMEAVRSFRKEKTWSGPEGIVSIANGADYYPSIAAGEWILLSGQESIDGVYTRKIVFEPVSRDANDDIEIVYNPANDDPGARKITAEVSWNGGTKTTALVTYITNFSEN